MFSTQPVRRRLSALAVAGGLIVSVAACAPAQTAHYYGASDGTRVALDSGTLEVINMMVVVDSDGTGYLLGAVHNDSTQDHTATLTTQDGSLNEAYQIPAGGTINLSTDTEIPVLDTVSVPSGANLTVTLSDSAGDSHDIPVPVLEGSLPEYQEFLETQNLPSEA